MDFNSLIAENVGSAGFGAVLTAAVYKVWKILKADRKEEDLSNAERQFRDEIRAELREMREYNHSLEDDKHTCEKQVAELMTRITWLEQAFSVCRNNHPAECPLLKHLGEEQFNRLGSNCQRA